MNQIKSLLALKKKTNNILHFVISILTLGLWFWVWLFLLVSTQSHNANIDRQIELAVAGNIGHGESSFPSIG